MFITIYGFNKLIILYSHYFVYYIKVDYENMRVAELKALAREHGLRGYSRLRKAELIALLQNNLSPPPAPCARPPKPTRGCRPPKPTRCPWPPTGKAPLGSPRRPPPPPPHSRPPQKFEPYQLKAKRGVIEPSIEE